MGSRWFNSVVVLFWLSTMTWLVVAKVVPPLRRGNPPSYESMYPKGTTEEPPVGWEMSLNAKPLGWAINRVARTGNDVTEVRGRIHFNRIPLQEFSPTWAQFLLKTIANPADNAEMDVFSTLEIDPLGHLTRFRSALRVPGMPESVLITGVAKASRLEISVESGDIQAPKFEAYLPKDALVADELSPQTRITGLRLNQEWTVPVFSPLRPPKNPVEILQAKVESRDPIKWEGKVCGAFQVVYRADSGSVLSSTREPRAKLWVRDDGMVLKQEVNLLGSRLVFTRMTEAKSAEMSEQAEQDDREQRQISRQLWWERRQQESDGEDRPQDGGEDRPRRWGGIRERRHSRGRGHDWWNNLGVHPDDFRGRRFDLPATGNLPANEPESEQPSPSEDEAPIEQTTEAKSK